jgi:hypothetical protein
MSPRRSCSHAVDWGRRSQGAFWATPGPAHRCGWASCASTQPGAQTKWRFATARREPVLRYFSKAIALDSVANSNDTIADSARVGTHLDRWSMTLLACPAEARSCVTRAEAGVPKGNRAAWTDGQTAENALDPAACLLSGRFAVNEARPNVDPEPLEHGPDTVQEYYRWSAHCPGSRVVPLPPDECVQQVEQAGIE